MPRVCPHGYGAFYLMLTGDKSYHTVPPSKNCKAYNLLSTRPVAAGTRITMQIEGIQIYRTLNPDFLDDIRKLYVLYIVPSCGLQ
jgi:hypothetical protein